MSGRIAFYAPLKSPAHPLPSGDRTMARLLLRALGGAGFEPSLASELRSLDLAGDPDRQRAIREKAEAEADALVARWRAAPTPERPRLWFTYHVYYKAPDWIGPRVADGLGIPYAVAEASRAAKRAEGPWAVGHAGAEAALDRADVIFVTTQADGEALERARPPGQRLVSLPPFLDLEGWGRPASPAPGVRSEAPRLLTVAMMRAGDKLASYALLARALARLADRPWTLDIVGDGEARPEVERLFAGFGAGRLRWLGAVEDGDALAAFYATSDLLVWPAVNEAYGMALLEAQALGCPVLAGGCGGVASVVRDGETGLLARCGDAGDFARALAGLLADRPALARMGDAARRFVREERTIAGAALTLRAGLAAVLNGRAA